MKPDKKISLNADLHSEFLILDDGSLLVHNMTPVMADILRQMEFELTLQTEEREYEKTGKDL